MRSYILLPVRLDIYEGLFYARYCCTLFFFVWIPGWRESVHVFIQLSNCLRVLNHKQQVTTINSDNFKHSILLLKAPNSVDSLQFVSVLSFSLTIDCCRQKCGSLQLFVTKSMSIWNDTTFVDEHFKNLQKSISLFSKLQSGWNNARYHDGKVVMATLCVILKKLISTFF